MSGRLKRAIAGRRWFDLPLALLGLALIVLGSCFFVFVYAIGAPVVPFGGLIIAAFGLWIGLLRPLWRPAPELTGAAPQETPAEG